MVVPRLKIGTITIAGTVSLFHCNECLFAVRVVIIRFSLDECVKVDDYVRMKSNACKRVGMESLSIVMPQSTTTDKLLSEIDKLNVNPDVHGILLQHPVPGQIDERRCFDRISVEKDVDGVTTLGFGRMAMNVPAYGSATPAGIMRLLRHYDIMIEGKNAVVVGRSPILGKPIAMMLLNANATVTICHSKTQ